MCSSDLVQRLGRLGKRRAHAALPWAQAARRARLRGDGGRGGDVWAECVEGLNTLIDYRYQQHFKAKSGGHGMGKNRAGGKGTDVILKVPKGTQIFEEDGETLIADLTEIGQTVTLAKGSNGGFGNAYFTTSKIGRAHV